MGPIHTETLGGGEPTLVFLHPTPADSSVWVHQMFRFGTWWHTMTVDLPGYGRSGSLAADDDMASIARSTWRALEAQGIERCVLIGMSAGSTVAQHMAAQHPGRALALVLTGGGYFAPEDRRFQAAVLANIEDFQRHGATTQVRKFTAGFGQDRVDSEFLAYLASILEDRRGWLDVTTVVRLYGRLLDPLPAAVTNAIACPTLIISGAHDPGHRAHADLARRIRGARFVTIPAADHMCHVERPARYDRILLGFLARIGLSNPGSGAHGIHRRAGAGASTPARLSRLGQGPSTMAFIDAAVEPEGHWFYEMMHASTYFESCAVDVARMIPGRGSPGVDELAHVAWHGIGTDRAVLVGTTAVAPLLAAMARVEPQRTLGLILADEGSEPLAAGLASSRVRYVRTLRGERARADDRGSVRGAIEAILRHAPTGAVGHPLLLVTSEAATHRHRPLIAGDALESTVIQAAGPLARPAAFANAVDAFVTRHDWIPERSAQRQQAPEMREGGLDTGQA